MMDIPRPSQAKRKLIQRFAIAGGTVIALALTTLSIARLKPAPPSVERATVWVDTVRRGEMLRQVRGVGSLVPEDIRWIPAATEGRVERIVLQPGTTVRADSVVLELSNPELGLAVEDAESQAKVARAQLTELRARLGSQRLDQQAALARTWSQHNQARLKADACEQLARKGLVAAIDLKIATDNAREAAEQLRIEQERQASQQDAASAQLAAKALEVEQREGFARLKRSQRDGLSVRAGLDGVLQLVPVEVGQRVSPGTNLARIAEPTRLKAVVRVPETLAKDVQLGQKAVVDTRNGEVSGHVARVDPAAREGTVAVDIALDSALPKGARPDLTVDGTIELERLADAVFVGRPAQGQADMQVGLFRLEPAGKIATRVKVRLGRASVSSIEVIAGLKPGDQVILSDTSAWDAFERIRLE
jgi:HlyD family secretion protein